MRKLDYREKKRIYGNTIGVYMEGLYLRKWDAKHVLLYTVGGSRT
jgi:hypothetical protein